MKFTLSDEQRQFRQSLHEALAAADVPAAIRAWGGSEHERGTRIWRLLAELGVTALAVPESDGGLDAEPADAAVAMEALGYHAVPGPLVESIAVVPTVLRSPGADRHPLAGIAGGTVLASAAFPPHVPYALDADVAELVVQVNHGRCRSVTAGTGEPLRSVDPARRLFTVDAGNPIELTADADAASRAFEFGVLCVSAQLLGAGQRLLESSVAYAKQREQYGRPIGQYQAVKHLLADVATELELARPLLHGAAVALDGSTGGADIAGSTVSRDVSAAKVSCADAAYLAARTALQVHGAIGYTAEHDLGLYLRKVRALFSAWGTQAYHRQRVISAVAA